MLCGLMAPAPVEVRAIEVFRPVERKLWGRQRSPVRCRPVLDLTSWARRGHLNDANGPSAGNLISPAVRLGAIGALIPGHDNQQADFGPGDAVDHRHDAGMTARALPQHNCPVNASRVSGSIPYRRARTLPRIWRSESRLSRPLTGVVGAEQTNMSVQNLWPRRDCGL
jgi:hypothetical protein